MTEETNASESEIQITPVEASVLLSGAEWDPKLLATTLAQEWEITVPEKDLPADASESLVFEAEGAVIAVKLFEEPLPADPVRPDPLSLGMPDLQCENFSIYREIHVRILSPDPVQLSSCFS